MSCCGLLCTTRRWLGCLVDHLGSWTDFTFQDRPDCQNGRNDKEWLPCCGRWRRSPIARVPSAGPLGAKSPHQTTAANQANQECSWAPAALDAPAKETRHRVTVCPSARLPVLPALPCPSLQSQTPRLPAHPTMPGPPESERPGRREPEDLEPGDREAYTGRQANEVSVRKGPTRRRSDIQHSKAHT